MEPQHTDVLDVGGPAAAPSIIEGTIPPQSPLNIDYELFDDEPAHAGTVPLIEPAPAVHTPADTVDELPAIAVTPLVTESFEAEAPAQPVASAEVEDEPLPADAAPTQAIHSQETAVETENPVVPDALTTDAPEPESAEEVDAPAPAVATQAEAAAAPAQPEFSVSLEDLELALDTRASKKAAEAATTGPEAEAAPITEAGSVVEPEPAVAETTDDSPDDLAEKLTDGTIAEPSSVAEVRAAAEAEAVPAPVPAVPEQSTDLTEMATGTPEPVMLVAEPARPQVSTYEDIQNSAQQFEGAIKVKKFPLIDPDQYWVMIVALVALSGILAANLTSSFTSVYAMAAYIGLPREVQWLPVVTLDVAIVGFSWALMVFGARGDKVWTTRLYLFVVTGFSVVANFLHTYTYWHGRLTTPEHIFGVVFSSAVPVFSLVATEELIRLVFIRRVRRTKKAVK